MAEAPFIYRFARDLRLDDHAGLATAASYGSVLPLLVIDRALRTRLRRSPRRAAFFCAAVRALDGELRERGSRLSIRRGESAAAIARLARTAGARGAAWSASYDDAGMECDQQLQSALEELGLVAVAVHDAAAIAPEEISPDRAGGGYRAFAPYFDVWRELTVNSYEHPLLLRFAACDLESEPLPTPAEFGADAVESDAGAATARRTFEQFLRERAMRYAPAAVVPSQAGTSRLSADLSFGTISARTIVTRVRDRLTDPFSLSEERLSLKAFLRALAQRDFFLQLSWFQPCTAREPLQEKMRGFRWARSHPALEAWHNGETGYPLVDAGIRQLRETGWMHPHVRAVVASFLCFDLGIDWRLGCEQWDRWLIEDDPALATGNWQWIAGVGADMAQYPRIYNPERQRRRYDPEGTYVRRWIRELAHVPIAAWRNVPADAPQLELNLFADESYPRPVVDHARAGRAFLARYRDFSCSGSARRASR